jgi:hypothetical protein
MILRWDQIYLKGYKTSFPSSAHWPRSHSGWMSYGLPNEALSGCRRTESSTLMNLHIETHLYLHSNNDMYMWNQVNCTKNHYANVGTSSPYKQWLYPMVSCPHHVVLWDHTNRVCGVAAIVYEGNEARRCLARSSIVKIAGNCLEEAISKTHLCVRKA